MGTTWFTLQNAQTFAQERLVREAVLFTLALEHGSRQLGRVPVDQLGELLSDDLGEGVRGVAVVERTEGLIAWVGEEIREDLTEAPWVQRATVEREIGIGPDGDESVSIAVPSRIGCPGSGRGHGHFQHEGHLELSYCSDPGLALVVSLDTTEANEPVAQARNQAVFVGFAMLLAWGIAWRWHQTTSRTRQLELQAQTREKLAALGEMAAVMAHEIRNPLGAIRGHAQLVASKLCEDERAKPSLETIVTETSRLSKLVDGLLRYARPRLPDSCNVEMVPFIDRIVALVAEQGREIDVKVERLQGEDDHPDNPIVDCDPQQIEQVLLNLIRNAMQAQPDGGRVVLHAAADEAEAVITVEDEGPGIPLSERERFFLPFVTTRAEGSGLGLAIARQIAEAHGGSLTAMGSDLGGAAFVLRLPMRRTTP